ncbi:purine-nucleoside phosphorylase [Clostridium saccharobutylicum]|nr:purine-nucleoside phosphorylase [Clostridium saccharobutylicum]
MHQQQVFKLLKPAYDIAIAKGLDPKVGSIYSSDVFMEMIMKIGRNGLSLAA